MRPAFTARSADGKRQIWVRTLDSSEAHPLPGTDDPVNPLSPDGRSPGFGAQGKLKRVDWRAVVRRRFNALRFIGGTWSRDCVILCANETAACSNPGYGGEPRRGTVPSAEKPATAPVLPARWPSLLYQAGCSTSSSPVPRKQSKCWLTGAPPCTRRPTGCCLSEMARSGRNTSTPRN